MASVSCLQQTAVNRSDTFKVSNMVEGLEQELADITDSGDFAAYQVLLPTIEKFDLTILSTFPGIPCKLHWHLAPPPPLPAHHCTEEPDTVSLLQVSLSLSPLTSHFYFCWSSLRSSSKLSSSLRSSSTYQTMMMASTPVTERTGIQELRYRVQLCRDFHTVLAKVGFDTIFPHKSTTKERR